MQEISAHPHRVLGRAQEPMKPSPLPRLYCIGVGTSLAPARHSNPKELLLLGLELLLAQDALVAELGETLQFTHVLRLG
jgi:hypothetical protein